MDIPSVCFQPVPVKAQAEMTSTYGHPRLNWPVMAKVNSCNKFMCTIRSVQGQVYIMNMVCITMMYYVSVCVCLCVFVCMCVCVCMYEYVH